MHVVHMEDDPSLKELFRVSLHAADPTIKLQQFISSNDTLAYAAEHLKQIHLFVLDIRVPGDFDGLQVTERLREIGYKGLIVVTSAYSQPERKFLEGHNCTWMSKPWFIVDAARTFITMIKESTTGGSDTPVNS
jgi:DNA-binding response OmpR family regulator